MSKMTFPCFFRSAGIDGIGVSCFLTPLRVVCCFVFCMSALASGQVTYTFEGGVPAQWSSVGGGTLSTSPAHFKEGAGSLKWSWVAGSKARLNDPTNLGTAAGVKLWIYNEAAIEDDLVFYIGAESEVVAGLSRYTFTFGLNFTGWRAAWVHFSEDATNPAWTGDTAMDVIYIEAPLVGGGDLYLDLFELADSIATDRSRDYQVPFVNAGQQSLTDYWQHTYKWSQQEPNDVAPAAVTPSQSVAFGEIKRRYLDFLVADGGLSPGPGDSVAMLARKHSLERRIDNRLALYDSYNIVHDSNSVTGVGLFCRNSEHSPQVADDFGEDVLFPLALDYVLRGNSLSRDKFLAGLDHMHDQGWAEGSAMGSLDHQQNNIAGWLNGVFLMWDELSGVQKDYVAGSLGWYSEFGELYLRPFEHAGTTADRFMSIEIPRLVRILLMDDSPEKVRDMRNFIEWLGNAYGPSSGWAGTVKPDYVGYHHLGIQSHSYVPHALHAAGLMVYLLSETEFAIGSEAMDSVRQWLLSYRLYVNKYDHNIGIGGRSGGKNFDSLIETLPAYAYLALAESDPSTSEMAAVFKRLYDTSYPGVIDMWSDSSTTASKMWVNTLGAIDLMEEVNAFPIAAEITAVGNWAWNWAALMVQRRDEWMASVKGWSRYVLNYESSKSTNKPGWNQSSGGLQIIPSDGRLAAGYDLEKGWDWNRYPGTTSVSSDHYGLAAKDHRYFTDEGFVGGLSLDAENGVFAMSLHDNLYGLNLRAKKSFFFFDDIIVCLGSDISETSGSGTVETTLFQGILSSPSDPIYDNSASPITSFPYTRNYSGSGAVWLMDAFGNGYYVADRNSLKIRKQFQQSPKPNGVNIGTGNAALAWIDHGVLPNTAQYEYAIQVQATVGQIGSFAANPTYDVLRKDSLAHVAEDSLTSTIGYAIFDASAQFEYGYLEAVSNPCLIMIKPVAADRLHISIADPNLRIDDGGNPDQNVSGLTDDSIFFNESTGSEISVDLRGKWLMLSGSPGAKMVQSSPGGTELEFFCIDGKSLEVELFQPSYDMSDFAVVSAYFMAGCVGPGWCEGADLNISGSVDPNDVRMLGESWVGN